MTLLISGVGRSGTSAVAKVLHELGMPMGNTANKAVYEDEDFLQSLLYFDHLRLRQLINERNRNFNRWGIKFPSLQNHLLPPQISQFRNPHLIVVMRDLVATASRAFSSDPEKKTIKEAFLNVTQQMSDLTNFILRVECPVLLLSYEKLLAFPDQTIDQLVTFCDLELTDETRQRARQAIEPNNPDYINLFHNQLRGHFDNILSGFALGWCAARDSEEPVEVEILANGKVLTAGKADLFRQDLLNAGIGTGCHSFKIDISRCKIAKKAVLQVRAVGSEYVIDGSGRPYQDFIRK